MTRLMNMLRWWVSRYMTACAHIDIGWLRLVGSLKLQVSFAEYSLLYRDFLQKRRTNLRSLLMLRWHVSRYMTACAAIRRDVSEWVHMTCIMHMFIYICLKCNWMSSFDWCCFYYLVRSSLVALLEALCAPRIRHVVNEWIDMTCITVWGEVGGWGRVAIWYERLGAGVEYHFHEFNEPYAPS